MSRYPDNVRWFDPIGRCSFCDKAAVGYLMSNRNAKVSAACAVHAKAALAHADRAIRLDNDKR